MTTPEQVFGTSAAIAMATARVLIKRNPLIRDELLADLQAQRAALKHNIPEVVAMMDDAIKAIENIGG